MDYHQNARLVVYSREQMAKMVVQQGSTLKAQPRPTSTTL
jgi:hypothetical protein